MQTTSSPPTKFIPSYLSLQMSKWEPLSDPALPGATGKKAMWPFRCAQKKQL